MVEGASGISPVGAANSTTTSSNTYRWPSRVFAPYVDVLLWPTLDVSALATSTGVKHFTLAFIISDTAGNPAWGGITPYSSGFYLDVIGRVRANGGDVIVSFGGANGQELAQTNTVVVTLAAKYAQVLDLYGANAMDLDIEGGALVDGLSIDRRNKALALLKKSRPNLMISYTLPVLPTGLTADGLNVLNNAKQNGLVVDAVNIMAMDYGDSVAPNGATGMGGYAISAAQKTYQQSSQILGTAIMIGITPMIGQNDVESEVFRLQDATQLVQWAFTANYVSRLSMWSMNRDNGNKGALYASSQIVQTNYAFAGIFKAFTSGAAGATTTAPLKPTTMKPVQPVGPQTPATTSASAPTTSPLSSTWPGRTFAPYVDVTAWPPFDILNSFNKYGVRHVVLAFIVADTNNNPSWGGYYNLDANWYLDSVTKLRSLGGDVIISFGGAAGSELALKNTDPVVLHTKYQSVIDKYRPTWVDFDVEGHAMDNWPSIQRRNKALAALKKANPGLIVSYTLAVDPTGLEADAVRLLKDADNAGLDVDVVNIMAMDFAPSQAPQGKTLMSQYVIQAATNTHTQLVAAGLTNTQVGVTPMLGVNDVASQIFGLNDAQKLVNWAKTVPWVSFIGFWSLGRDNSNSKGGVEVSSCIVQADFAFSQIIAPWE